MKNCPPVENASTIIATPEIRPNHQNSFIPRSPKAWTIQKIPTIRNRKPSTSAIPAKVFLGADEGDDSGDHEQDAEEDEHPADHAVHQPRDHELLDARSQEDRADQDAHSGDRRLVELQDHQWIQDPDEAEHQPEPSELAQAYEDFPHFTSLC
jgi:hypothetical protein